MWIRALADADLACGAKAANLARLIRAGLPVPDGFVIGGATGVGAHVDVPDELRDEVVARAQQLGRVVVRSSASIEDGSRGAAPGVFESRVDVDDVWEAVRAVWASALTPLAAAYAHRRDEAPAISVIVQRFAPGERITVYTRPPGAPAIDELWIQRGEHLQKLARGTADPIARLALAAEEIIGADADVELAGGAVVQARPIVHPAPRAQRTPPPPILLAALVADGRPWAWDIAHNPDPLSPAQQYLVSRVARLDLPFELRIVGGYLYSTARDAQPPTERIADLEAAAAAALDEPGDPFDRYVRFYAIWARLSARISAAKRGLPPRRVAIPHDPHASPAWDVAVPTLAERGITSPPRAVEHDPDDPRAAAERDDVLFSRAQWIVRKHLLARGDDDVFWLADPTAELDPDDLRRRAAAARAAHARAAAWDMPLVVNGPPAPRGEPLRGLGFGPRAIGRVVHYASLADARPAPRGSIVVARAITPALAMLVADAAALVSETGGLLDHGAALARELGITCVVGCAGAWSLLADGQIVEVDGDAGRVEVAGAQVGAGA